MTKVGWEQKLVRNEQDSKVMEGVTEGTRWREWTVVFADWCYGLGPYRETLLCGGDNTAGEMDWSNSPTGGAGACFEPVDLMIFSSQLELLESGQYLGKHSEGESIEGV